MTNIKNILFGSLSLLAIGLVVLAGTLVFQLINDSFNKTPATITITGYSKINYIPDEAVITAGVLIEGQDPKDIQIKSDNLMKGLVNFLKEEGIEEKNLKTTRYNLSPKYDFENYNQIIGYSLEQTLEVKLKDFSKVGEIVAGLTRNGANEIKGLSFVLSDEAEKNLKKEARELAIADAYQNLDNLKRSLNIKNIKLIGFSEDGNQPITYQRFDATLQNEYLKSPISPILAGENEFVSNVYLVFELR